jgi:hypothetical protein
MAKGEKLTDFGIFRLFDLTSGGRWYHNMA